MCLPPDVRILGQVGFEDQFPDMARYEVTFEQWEACVAAGGCSHMPEDRNWGRGKRPVINVNWYSVQEYVGWLSQRTGKSYRLLSEAEWEYAARGGAGGQVFGEGNANCDGCGSRWDNKQTAPVGSFQPNGFGLHDMQGNVWEWTQDCWNMTYTGAPSDGSAWTSGQCFRRVLKGGSAAAVAGLRRIISSLIWYISVTPPAPGSPSGTT